MEQLSQQVSGLRKALDTQADVSENLGAIVTAMDRRLAAVETHRTSDYDPGTAGTVRPEESTTSPAGKSRLLGLNRPTGEIASTSRVDWKGLVGSTQQQELLDVEVTSPRSQPQSPQWSAAVKKGRKKLGSLKANVPPKPHNKPAHFKREQRNDAIIGTGTESNIGVVKTKLVNVFATRFSPTLDADTLRDYLTEKL